MRDAGQDDAVEVGHERLERLRRLRRGVRQLAADLAGRYPRGDRQLADPLHVARHPLDQLVAMAAEVLGGHVEVVRHGGQYRRMTAGPAVWIGPEADERIVAAVEAAGGRVTGPEEAQAAVWTGAPDGLKDAVQP